jgi:hypothetical protein
MRDDYIRTAWAKGLSLRTVLSVHALRNAMLPVLTLLALELASLLNGTVIMEVIFTLPGMGRFLVDAILHRDYPVVQAIVVIMAMVYVVLNLVVDLMYGLLDPRIAHKEPEKRPPNEHSLHDAAAAIAVANGRQPHADQDGLVQAEEERTAPAPRRDCRPDHPDPDHCRDLRAVAGTVRSVQDRVDDAAQGTQPAALDGHR